MMVVVKLGHAAASLLAGVAVYALLREPDGTRALARMTRDWILVCLAALLGSLAYAAIRHASRTKEIH